MSTLLIPNKLEIVLAATLETKLHMGKCLRHSVSSMYLNSIYRGTFDSFDTCVSESMFVYFVCVLDGTVH